MSEKDSLLKRTFAVIGANSGALLIAAGWPYLVLALGMLAWGVGMHLVYYVPENAGVDPISLWHSMHWASKLAVVIGYLASGALPPVFAKAGVTALVWKYCETGATRSSDAWEAIRPMFFRLVLLGVVIFWLSQIASAVFIVPGLVVAIFLSFAVPDMVIEKSKGLPALNRSLSLTSAKFGTVSLIYLGVLAVAFALMMLVITAVSILNSFAHPWWANLLLIFVAIGVGAPPVAMTFATLLALTYRDAREKRGELAVVQASA